MTWFSTHYSTYSCLESIDEYGVYLTQLTGDISFENQDISINELKALSEQGELLLEGKKVGTSG